MKANQDFFRPTQKIVTHAKTHAKKFDPRKNIFDPRNPRKKYFDPRNPRNPRKKLTHATQGPT